MKILGQANLYGLSNTFVKRSIANLLLGLYLGFIVPTSQSVAIANDQIEYQVKTAFIYNFIAFTQWPDSIGEDMRLCIYGEDIFGGEIDKLQNKLVNKRHIKVMYIKNLEKLKACQVVFFSESVNNNLSGILNDLQNEPILTLSDSLNATSQNVAINMSLVKEKIVFEISLETAHKSGLNFSSKLLQLATRVYE